MVLAAPPEARRFPGPEVDREGSVIGANVEDEWSPHACVVLAFWATVIYLSVCLLYYSWLARIYTVVLNIFFVYQGNKTGLGELMADLAGVPLREKKATAPEAPGVNGTVTKA